MPKAGFTSYCSPCSKSALMTISFSASLRPTDTLSLAWEREREGGRGRERGREGEGERGRGRGREGDGGKERGGW